MSDSVRKGKNSSRMQVKRLCDAVKMKVAVIIELRPAVSRAFQSEMISSDGTAKKTALQISLRVIAHSELCSPTVETSSTGSQSYSKNVLS